MKTLLWILGGGLAAWLVYRIATKQPVIPSAKPATPNNAPAPALPFWSNFGKLTTQQQTKSVQDNLTALQGIGKSIGSAFGGASSNSSGPSSPSTSGSGSGAPTSTSSSGGFGSSNDSNDFGGDSSEFGDDGSDYGDD